MSDLANRNCHLDVFSLFSPTGSPGNAENRKLNLICSRTIMEERQLEKWLSKKKTSGGREFMATHIRFSPLPLSACPPKTRTSLQYVVSTHLHLGTTAPSHLISPKIIHSFALEPQSHRPSVFLLSATITNSPL